MPARASSLGPAFVAGALAAGVLLGNTTVSSATGCLENPHPGAAGRGHWYYRSDRTQHRRCWFFVPAEVTADAPASSAPPAATAGDDYQQSWLSLLMPGLLQPPSPPPQPMEAPQAQPNPIPDRSGEATQAISSKPVRRSKTVRREQPRMTPPPTTTGAAERRDQPKQGVDEKQPSPLNEAERESLFQDFLKWQMDRHLFGRP